MMFSRFIKKLSSIDKKVCFWVFILSFLIIFATLSAYLLFLVYSIDKASFLFFLSLFCISGGFILYNSIPLLIYDIKNSKKKKEEQEIQKNNEEDRPDYCFCYYEKLLKSRGWYRLKNWTTLTNNVWFGNKKNDNRINLDVSYQAGIYFSFWYQEKHYTLSIKAPTIKEAWKLLLQNNICYKVLNLQDVGL